MRLFRTKTGKVWHIVKSDGHDPEHWDEYHASRTVGLCDCRYQVGGTYSDGHTSPEIIEAKDTIGTEVKLCKPGILIAWETGVIKLQEIT